jgi:hypothetical protein
MRWIGLPRNSIEPFWGSRMPEMEDARDGFQHRGLAGAVGAEQRDDLAARHFEADATNGHDRPVIAFDIAELEDDVGGAHRIIPL